MSGPGYSGEEKKKTFESNIILERYGGQGMFGPGYSGEEKKKTFEINIIQIKKTILER